MARERIESIFGPRGLLKRLSADERNRRLQEAVQDTQTILETAILSRVPHDTSLLADHVRVDVEQDMEGRYRIIAHAPGLPDKRDLWTEEGTGIFGPHREPIRPTHGPYMTFYSKKFGRWRRVSEVAGQPGQHWLRRGWEAGMRKARRVLADVLKVTR